MKSKKVATRAEIDARGTQVAPFSERELRAQSQNHRDLVVARFDGFGAALIEMYEAGAEHQIKIDLLDQFVSIIRSKRRPDERAREIAKLMRGW